mgnify:CR=1 FL=1
MKKIINTSNAPSAIGTYSQAVMVNGFLYTSGQIGIDPSDGSMVSGGVRKQTDRVLNNIEAILLEAGLNKKNIIKLTVFLMDLEDFQHGLERSTAEYENPSNDRNYAHREFYIDYLNRQDGESDRLVDSSEALKSLLIIHAIYKSIEEDREVFLSEDNLQSKLGE